MVNRKILNKSIYYIILTLLYTILFTFVYKFIGAFAGTIGVIFIFIIAAKFKYTDVIIFGLLLTFINIYLNFRLMGGYSNLNIRILNHSFIIVLGALVSYLIQEKRLIKQQYIQIKETYEKLKDSNIALEREIEKRINAEKFLKEKERQFRIAIEECPVNIMIHSEYGEIISISKVCTDITGYTIQDFKTTLQWSQMVLGLKEDILEESVRKLVNLGDRTYNGEYTIRTKDGEVRVWDSYSSYIGELYDGCKMFMRVGVDITEKKHIEELERKIEQERKILNEVRDYDKLKTEFFANLSHEFRTPINVIFSAVQLHELKLKTLSSESISMELFKQTKIMKQNCYRILRLVNNLLDVTKIDAGCFELDNSNQDIVSLIENIVLSVADYIESKGLSLVFDTDVEEKIIACDQEKIERIMLNLLSNSIKFTPCGGSIMVNIEDKIETVCIRVKDTGRGISKEKLNIIFERFVQVDKSLSRDNEGSGIGLALVKSLVEMHDGTISVKSKESEGTEFIINIPCKLLDKVTSNKDSYLGDSNKNSTEKINIEFSDIYN